MKTIDSVHELAAQYELQQVKISDSRIALINFETFKQAQAVEHELGYNVARVQVVYNQGQGYRAGAFRDGPFNASEQVDELGPNYSVVEDFASEAALIREQIVDATEREMPEVMLAWADYMVELAEALRAARENNESVVVGSGAYAGQPGQTVNYVHGRVKNEVMKFAENGESWEIGVIVDTE